MGLLDRIDIPRKRREQVMDRHGSPPFIEFHGIIANGATAYREIRDTFPTARKWEPMDNIIVTNNSDEDLRLDINGQSEAFVPAKSGVNIHNRAVWTYALTNLSGTSTSADEVHVVVQREPLNADKAVQRNA